MPLFSKELTSPIDVKLVNIIPFKTGVVIKVYRSL
jgi:hypothetical protein